MAVEHININGQVVKVNDEEKIELIEDFGEIKTELYFVKLTNTVFVDCNKFIVMVEELQNSLRDAFDELNWAREVAEDMNGTVYQVVLKDMRTER